MGLGNEPASECDSSEYAATKGTAITPLFLRARRTRGGHRRSHVGGQATTKLGCRTQPGGRGRARSKMGSGGGRVGEAGTGGREARNWVGWQTSSVIYERDNIERRKHVVGTRSVLLRDDQSATWGACSRTTTHAVNMADRRPRGLIVAPTEKPVSSSTDLHSIPTHIRTTILP